MKNHRKTNVMAGFVSLGVLLAPTVHALLEPEAEPALGMLGVRQDLQKAGVPGGLLPLVGLPPTDPPLPDDPVTALSIEVARFLADLGFDYDPSEEIAAVSLDPTLAGRSALALAALHGCLDATQASQELLPAAQLALILQGQAWESDPQPFQAIRGCAVPAAQAIVNLEAAAQALEASSQSASSLDVWPVLAIDNGGDDFYENDYVLIVELDGDDVYDNNAGSNLIDLRFAPTSSPFPGIDPIPHIAGLNDGDDDRSGFGPSEGCAIAVSSLESGNCTPIVSAFVDVEGDDQYGVFEPPVPGVDARCTADPVIRRMITNGAGLLGFGMLLDSRGDDSYNGRTGSGGVAHVFAVGILEDREGNDIHLDIRNAQGFSLLGGVGLLVDERGSDTYSRYMPSALVPGTPDEQDGAGGVIDDTNLCDTKPRLMQGAAFLPGSVGVLLDLDGQDSYDGSCTVDFGATLLGNGDIGAPVCSQGFGATGGLGVLLDRGSDADAYLGVPDRGDGLDVVRATPSVQATPEPDAALSIEAFSDR